MAVRLQMKLGVVPETDRQADSSDTIAVVEPAIGSTARTKGSLYMLVTGVGGKRLHEATRLVAEKIESEYYYDESAGIAVCLKKAIRAANKRLLHGGDRYRRHGEPGPIGLAIAVVRGGELYVCTLGPAEAYLVRQARLLTLPDANPNDGLPTETGAEPEVWHGEIAVGDSLFLVSPNITRQINLSPIQEGAVTLHPQAAVQQIHRQFLAAGGTGSDGILAIEATEVPSTHKSRPLKPVWPSEPLAGAPDRSPIPLVDTVSDGMAAMQGSAREARVKAGGAFRRSFEGLFDLMPRRQTARSRVTPMAMRRERQRRYAFAAIGLILMIAVLGVGFSFIPESDKGQPIDAIQKGEAAYAKIVSDYNSVFGDNRDLLQTNRQKAGEYLKDAYAQLDVAAKNGYDATKLADYRVKIVDALNRYYGVIYVKPAPVMDFGNDSLTDVVLGPDGAAYVVDSTANAVYRVDLTKRTKSTVAQKGQQPPGGTVATPRLLAVGGIDVLVLDSNNALWRWRPIVNDAQGRGNLIRIQLKDASSWSGTVRSLGTFVTNASVGLYALYVVDPAARQVLKYPALADGTGYGERQNYFLVSQDVGDVDDMIIDGSLYVAEGGTIKRFDGGDPARGWAPQDPGDGLLRAGAPRYTRIATPSSINVGDIYAYDSVNHRVVSFAKQNGAFDQQFMIGAGSTGFNSVGGMFVLPGPNGQDPTLFWLENGRLMSAALNPSAASAQPSPSPAASGSAKPSTKPTAKPTAKPKTTRRP